MPSNGRRQGELVSDDERRSARSHPPARRCHGRNQRWKPGRTVANKQLLARGTTQIFFQANIWIFTALSLIIGAVMGIGKAAVYKHIPDYFPDDVGVWWEESWECSEDWAGSCAR